MKIITCLAVLASLMIYARADVIFSSFGAANTTSDGFMNPGTAWGDEITLGGTNAIVNSLSFQTASVVGSGTETLTLSLWNVNPGTDGIYQTADDKIGSQIGGSIIFNGVDITPNSTITLSGLSVSVPQNFIYTITDGGSGPSYLINFCSDENFPNGGYANSDMMWWNISYFSGTGPLTTGSSAGYYTEDSYWNPLIEITGSMTPVPEPSTLALAGLGGLGMLWQLRRRK